MQPVIQAKKEIIINRAFANEREIDMNFIKLGYRRMPGTEQIYTRIVSSLFMLREREGMSSFVFSGCDRNVGNTTISLSIASELAKADRRTLLVDCDFLKPATEKRLFQFVDVGLADHLSGNARPEDIINKTDIQALDYISSGRCLMNPTMMLWSDMFMNFMNNLAKRYEYIIFDTAPVLAAPEVCVIALRASGTILTVQFGKSQKSQIFASKKELEKMGANLLGVIVNKTPDDECRIYQKTHGFSIVLKGPQEIRSSDG